MAGPAALRGILGSGGGGAAGGGVAIIKSHKIANGGGAITATAAPADVHGTVTTVSAVGVWRRERGGPGLQRPDRARHDPNRRWCQGDSAWRCAGDRWGGRLGRQGGLSGDVVMARGDDRGGAGAACTPSARSAAPSRSLSVSLRQDPSGARDPRRLSRRTQMSPRRPRGSGWCHPGRRPRDPAQTWPCSPPATGAPRASHGARATPSADRPELRGAWSRSMPSRGNHHPLRGQSEGRLGSRDGSTSRPPACRRPPLRRVPVQDAKSRSRSPPDDPRTRTGRAARGTR